MGGASSFIKNSFENLKPICNVTRSQSTNKPTYKNEANVIFRAAAGRVSGFNQENGKMIVFVPEQLVHTELTLIARYTKSEPISNQG